MKHEELIEVIVKGMPYPNQIEEIQWDGEAIRFNWRSVRYRVSPDLFVEEVGNGVLVGSDRAILIQSLLKISFLDMSKNKKK